MTQLSEPYRNQVDALDNNELAINDLVGLNTAYPTNVRGAPSTLVNAAFDRRGGYTQIEDIKMSSVWNGIEIISVCDYGPGNVVLVMYRPPGETYVNVGVFDLELDQNVFFFVAVQTPQNKKPIGNLFQLGPEMAAVEAEDNQVIVFNKYTLAYPLTIPNNADIGTFQIEFHRLPTVGGVIPANSASPFSHAAGTMPGFSGRTDHYVFLYPQYYTEYDEGVTGSTLNPSAPLITSSLPIVLHLPQGPPDTAGVAIYSDYEIRIHWSPTYQGRVYAYGRAYSRRIRDYPELFDAASVWGASLVTLVGTNIRVVRADRLGRNTSFRYVAVKAGITGTVIPAFPTEYGETVSDNDVVWRCEGQYTYFAGNPFTPLTDYFDFCANPPTSFLPPSAKFPQGNIGAHEFGQLTVKDVVDGSGVRLYTSILAGRANPRDDDVRARTFNPFLFFPFPDSGNLMVAHHKDRCWMIPGAAIGCRVIESTSPGWGGATLTRPDVGQVIQPTLNIGAINRTSLAPTAPRKTLYYSEVSAPYDWRERFAVLPFSNSQGARLVRPIGEALMAVGSHDAVVILGSSESNLAIQRFDFPGAFGQSASVILNGVMYYVGQAGVFAVSGGAPQRISDPVANLFPGSGYTYSMTADPRRGLVYVTRYESGSKDFTRTFIYDVTTQYWSEYVHNTFRNLPAGLVSGSEFVDAIPTALDYPLFFFGGDFGSGISRRFMSLSGDYLPLTIEWEQIDAGNPTSDKVWEDVGFVVERDPPSFDIVISSSAPVLTIVAEGDQSSTVINSAVRRLTKAVNVYGTRFYDLSGWNLRFRLEISAHSNRHTIKPGIRFMVKLQRKRNKGFYSNGEA
jgi:hypothetical protein